VVIIDYQAWNGKVGIDYTNQWEDGHYSILIGFNDRFLFTVKMPLQPPAGPSPC